MPSTSTEFETQYAALTAGVALVDFTSRTQLEFTGADRAAFLHNLCTNNVRDLPVGSGCETFILNVKGHVVGHAFVFAAPESHVLETVPHEAETLRAHFERYLIREDVQLHDRSQQWAELLVSGPQSETLLNEENLPIPRERLSHLATQLAGRPIWIRRVDLAGPLGFLIAFRREVLGDVERALVAAGAFHCGDEAFEAARIERGTPLFGRDITPDNLPQEIDRDRFAISFTKGCYLGQETVARIDALGHVNRLLRGVKSLGDTVPAAGTPLHAAGDNPQSGKPIGQVTSAAWSPQLNAPLALTYVKRGNHEPGSKLTSPGGAAEVVALPLGA